MAADPIEGSLTAKAGRLQDATGDLVRDKANEARIALSDAMGSAQGVYDRVKDGARGGLDGAMSRTRKVRGEMQDFVSEQPGMAMGVVLGIGLVLALLLLGGRRSDRHG